MSIFYKFFERKKIKKIISHNMTMYTSKKGIEFIKLLEGYGPKIKNKYKAYKDAAGYLTIGIGHLLTEKEKQTGLISIKNKMVNYSHGLTLEEVDHLFIQDLSVFESGVNKLLLVNLNQDQYDSIISFAYNTGLEAFKKSTLLKKINSENFKEVPDEMIKWVFSNKKIIPGLVNRRKKEIELWNGNYNN